MDKAAPPAFDAIAKDIWDLKYRFKSTDGFSVDSSPDDTFRRVARAVAEAEPRGERDRWADTFHGLMKDYRFLPAGRILSGAGTGRSVTLFNCFVMGQLEDSMAGIFEGLKEAALTLQQGGGIGHDFSTLRPKGAPVKGVGADASGPLSFMDVWDSMCCTIMSAGSRRGAMMGTLRCDHPDIEGFVEAKRDPRRLRNFNLSVLVTDPFMAAVKNDCPWPLVFGGETYRVVQARHLWDQILRATYDCAEPGVIFIDRINAANNLAYCETIGCTNPCGEQPLPPYGACLLGSLNLARFVVGAFTPQAKLDESSLGESAALAVRLLDNVISISNYPLEQQRSEALAKRRIGLGITGLADALVMCGLTYGSPEAVAMASNWMAAIETAAYHSSIALAREKGPFPLFDLNGYGSSSHVSKLPQAIREAIGQHGIRNGLLTSVAPTGTISLFAGNVSSGIEPIFSAQYERKIMQPDGTRRIERITDYAVSLWRHRTGEESSLPPAFVTAETLSPHDHLVMQAAVQRHVDSSISKTINVPTGLHFEDFRSVYDEAYRLGLKGCTTFRPNEVTGSILSVDTSAAKVNDIAFLKQPLERQNVLPGYTYKLRWPESDHAIYITLNDIEESGRRRPFEIFINSKNMEHYAWTVALTRMISAVFRRSGDVSFVVEELKAVFDPRGGQWLDGRYVPSLLAAIGGVIEEHMLAIGFLIREEVDHKRDLTRAMAESRKATCPRCGEFTLTFQEGCATCLSCGYSKCS
jgi:ribonucleoside-diphosphate reductase alpha chain